MTTIGKLSGVNGSKRSLRITPRVSRRSYERHARSTAVQDLIESARQRWRQRYGSDPAAARLKIQD